MCLIPNIFAYSYSKNTAPLLTVTAKIMETPKQQAQSCSQGTQCNSQAFASSETSLLCISWFGSLYTHCKTPLLQYLRWGGTAVAFPTVVGKTQWKITLWKKVLTFLFYLQNKSQSKKVFSIYSAVRIILSNYRSKSKSKLLCRS